MSSTQTIRLLSPEEIATGDAGEKAHLRFPDPSAVFAERAVRLRQLAAGHPMRDFLVFMAEVAQAQHAVLAVPRSTALPDEARLAEAAREGLPPLAFPQWPLDPAWRAELEALLAALGARVQGAQAELVARLRSTEPGLLTRQAESLLSGTMFGLDLAWAPLIGAALQVHWVRLVGATRSSFPDLAFGRIADARVCPCCGSLPVASVARIGADDAGSRYLHCALCQAQWNMVRIQCAHCESGRQVTYQALEPVEGAAQPTLAVPRGAVRAECCGECGHYLKIVDMGRDAHVDPVADDLASVALDLLVGEAGFARHGVDFMMLWGEPSEDDPPRAAAP